MPQKADSLHSMQVIRDTKSMSVTFNAIDTASEKIIRTDRFNWKDVHTGCKDFVSLYGITTLLRDRNSAIQMVLAKLEAYRETFDETLLIGNLKRERAAQGKRLTMLQTEVLAKHFSKKSKSIVSLKDVTDGWSELTEDQKTAILAQPEIITMMTKAAKAPSEAKGVTFDDFLKK